MSWVRNWRRHVWHFEPSTPWTPAPRFICGSRPSNPVGGLAIEIPKSYRLCRNCERLYAHWQAGAMAYRGQSNKELG